MNARPTARAAARCVCSQRAAVLGAGSRARPGAAAGRAARHQLGGLLANADVSMGHQAYHTLRQRHFHHFHHFHHHFHHQQVSDSPPVFQGARLRASTPPNILSTGCARHGLRSAQAAHRRYLCSRPPDDRPDAEKAASAGEDAKEDLEAAVGEEGSKQPPAGTDADGSGPEEPAAVDDDGAPSLAEDAGKQGPAAASEEDDDLVGAGEEDATDADTGVETDEDELADEPDEDADGVVVDAEVEVDPEEVIDAESEWSGNESAASKQLVPNEHFWPDEVMILPLFVRPCLPETGMPLHISDEKTLSIIHHNWQQGKKFLGVFFVKEEYRDKDQADWDDISQLHGVGTLCSVFDIRRDPAAGPFVHVFGLQRIRIEKQIHGRPHVMAKIRQIQSKMPEESRKDYIKAYIQEIVRVMADLIKVNPTTRDYLMQLRHTMDQNPSRIADYAAAATSAQGAELQDVLETIDVDERLPKGLLLLKKELDMSNFQRSVAKQIEEKMTSQQRTMMLQEQLKLIKKELGLETDEKEQLLTKFRDRVAEINPPEHATKVINDEINKLSSLEPSSSEYNVTRTYLDWLTCLPWETHSEDNFDLERAGKVLDDEHYGLDDLKMRIKEFIAVGKLRGNIQGKIICLVGPPGVGKTSIGKSIAAAVDRNFFRFSVGGMSDVAEIKGHRRTYVGAMPGKLMQCLKQVQTSNPVILIDEIDKIGKGYGGDPASALLEVLDPSQNTSFLDHYLDVPYDLSKVLFVCTANVLETIPKPLLDRMEVMRLSGYVLDEKVSIATNYLVPEAVEAAGLEKQQVEIAESGLTSLIRWHCREAGVRNLQQHVEKIMRKIAYQVATKEKETVAVTEENLEDYVGKPIYTTDRHYETTPVGVVMGLAWTSMGGATLYIETAAVPMKAGEGGGSIRTTGQMGDVMKESSTISLSYARIYLDNLDPANHYLRDTHLHMHIPEGATPKDGPSAGITMVTSLLSLALDRPCRPDLAMTGELTLTGKVLKIGGVKEKVIAAKRSGVEDIILPADNKRDFDELPDFIKQGVNIHFADMYDDVYKLAFPDLK